MSCTNCGGETREEGDNARCIVCGYIMRTLITFLETGKTAMKSPKKGDGVKDALPLPLQSDDQPEEETLQEEGVPEDDGWEIFEGD